MKTEELEKLLAAETPVLVDFFSTTCDPCKWLLPILDELQAHFKNNLIIIKINVEQSNTLAHHYDIRSVPTLILFKKKKLLWRLPGFDTAPRMIALIEDHLAAY
ncbi:MAG: thioredoxin family protein [Bacteroidia bacterium]